jgi:hypothetical protein
MRFRQSLGVLGGILLLATCTESVVSGEKTAALHTEFGEIRLQNLAIGKTYSVMRMASEQLVISNTSNESLFVHVEPVVPAKHHLRGGALPVPDRNWVQLEATDLVLEAHSTVWTDVYLSLPYDPDLAGKMFQVDILSRDLQRGKDAQRHRLLFTVEMDPLDDTEWTFSMRALHRNPYSR